MKEFSWIVGLSFVFFCFAATAASLQGNSNLTPDGYDKRYVTKQNTILAWRTECRTGRRISTWYSYEKPKIDKQGTITLTPIRSTRTVTIVNGYCSLTSP